MAALAKSGEGSRAAVHPRREGCILSHRRPVACFSASRVGGQPARERACRVFCGAWRTRPARAGGASGYSSRVTLTRSLSMTDQTTPPASNADLHDRMMDRLHEEIASGTDEQTTIDAW